MEENGRPSSRKRPNPQFNKKGSFKKGKWDDAGREQSLGNSQASDTVYRILCQSRKIGSVIGKAGSIVRALREETRAKITVAESVPGSDERVIIIYSPSTKITRKHSTENADEELANEKEDNLMEPHCAAQDALLKVHDRIITEDLSGGVDNEDDNDNVVTARLLVPNNMVGCLLGKKGDVIQRLRSETGASIRVLPAEHLPACAMSSDELVQISGKPTVAKGALYEVSTLLHKNPRKDKPPSSFTMPYGREGSHPPGPPMVNRRPPGNPMWSEQNSNPHGLPAVPWMGEYGNEPSGFGPDGFIVPSAHGGESPSEFFMKILCSAVKIGGVIGKGGSNVKQMQQKTGASIHVEDVSAESDERVIRVSSFEALWNPRSQTVDAILQLQDKTSEFSDKGSITTRLLVPSGKVGCILGQGGHVINEMRRRTQADIRVYSKEDKPKCAAEDEELVQISGNYGVAKDALAEIASRLRTRCLRDGKAGAEPLPIRPSSGFSPAGNLHGRGPLLSRPLGASSAGRFEPFEGGGRDYGPPNYAVPPAANRYPPITRVVESMRPNAGRSVVGAGRSNSADIAGTRVKLQDPYYVGSDCVVEIRGSPQHLNNTHTQNVLQAFVGSPEENYPQHGSYHKLRAQQGAYPHNNASQTPQNKMAYQAPYQDNNGYQAFYQNYQHNGAQQSSPYQNYQNSGAETAHPYGNFQSSGTQQTDPHHYQNSSTQQASPYQNYQNVGSRQGSYQNISSQSSYQY